jgi:hypothetical protein
VTLERYAQLKNELAEIQNELALIEQELAHKVKSNGEIVAGGWRAYMKPGRKTTDHEAAARAADVPNVVIEKYTTVKTSVEWAQVTKAAGCPTAEFTTQGDPVFVVEAE